MFRKHKFTVDKPYSQEIHKEQQRDIMHITQVTLVGSGAIALLEAMQIKDYSSDVNGFHKFDYCTRFKGRLDHKINLTTRVHYAETRKKRLGKSVKTNFLFEHADDTIKTNCDHFMQEDKQTVLPLVLTTEINDKMIIIAAKDNQETKALLKNISAFISTDELHKMVGCTAAYATFEDDGFVKSWPVAFENFYVKKRLVGSFDEFDPKTWSCTILTTLKKIAHEHLERVKQGLGKQLYEQAYVDISQQVHEEANSYFARKGFK